MSLFGDIGSALKSVVKSPITKVVAGGVALVAPPIGGPALVGLAAADKLTSAASSGNAKAKAVITHTAALAKKGDANAKQSVTLLKTVAAAQKGVPSAIATVKTAVNASYKQLKKDNPAAAKKVIAVVANKRYKTAKGLNALVTACAKKDPKALAKVKALKAAASKGDLKARRFVIALNRRAAALRVGRKYRVDRRGMVVKG